MENRFFNMNLAGGAMLDIGVYALSMHSKQPKRAMISPYFLIYTVLPRCFYSFQVFIENTHGYRLRKS